MALFLWDLWDKKGPYHPWMVHIPVPWMVWDWKLKSVTYSRIITGWDDVRSDCLTMEASTTVLLFW